MALALPLGAHAETIWRTAIAVAQAAKSRGTSASALYHTMRTNTEPRSDHITDAERDAWAAELRMWRHVIAEVYNVAPAAVTLAETA